MSLETVFTFQFILTAEVIKILEHMLALYKCYNSIYLIQKIHPPGFCVCLFFFQ